MLEVLTGLVSGTVSGTGMGGGTILILILSVFMGIEQHTAQATNLVFFVPTSISAIITTIKDKLINWKVGIPVAIAGIVGAIIGAKISVNMDVKHLKKYFGIFLILISIYEIYSLIRQYKKDRKSNNKNIEKNKLWFNEVWILGTAPQNHQIWGFWGLSWIHLSNWKSKWVHSYKSQFILERRMKMKFVKGMIIGTAIAAGMAIMYNEGMMNKKTIMKKGRQLAKKVGVI